MLGSVIAPANPRVGPVVVFPPSAEDTIIDLFSDGALGSEWELHASDLNHAVTEESGYMRWVAPSGTGFKRYKNNNTGKAGAFILEGKLTMANMPETVGIAWLEFWDNNKTQADGTRDSFYIQRNKNGATHTIKCNKVIDTADTELASAAITAGDTIVFFRIVVNLDRSSIGFFYKLSAGAAWTNLTTVTNLGSTFNGLTLKTCIGQYTENVNGFESRWDDLYFRAA